MSLYDQICALRKLEPHIQVGLFRMQNPPRLSYWTSDQVDYTATSPSNKAAFPAVYLVEWAKARACSFFAQSSASGLLRLSRALHPDTLQTLQNELVTSNTCVNLDSLYTSPFYDPDTFHDITSGINSSRIQMCTPSTLQRLVLQRARLEQAESPSLTVRKAAMVGDLVRCHHADSSLFTDSSRTLQIVSLCGQVLRLAIGLHSLNCALDACWTDGPEHTVAEAFLVHTHCGGVHCIAIASPCGRWCAQKGELTRELQAESHRGLLKTKLLAILGAQKEMAVVKLPLSSAAVQMESLQPMEMQATSSSTAADTSGELDPADSSSTSEATSDGTPEPGKYLDFDSNDVTSRELEEHTLWCVRHKAGQKGGRSLQQQRWCPRQAPELQEAQDKISYPFREQGPSDWWVAPNIHRQWHVLIHDPTSRQTKISQSGRGIESTRPLRSTRHRSKAGLSWWRDSDHVSRQRRDHYYGRAPRSKRRIAGNHQNPCHHSSSGTFCLRVAICLSSTHSAQSSSQRIVSRTRL